MGYPDNLKILPDIVKSDKTKKNHLLGMAFHQSEQADVSLVLNSPQKPEKWKLKEKEIKN